MMTASSAAKTQVLLAVPHPLLRGALQEIVEQVGNIQVVGAVASGLQAVERARQLKPQVVLIDIRLPDMRAPEAVRLILRVVPGARVVILGDFDDDLYRTETKSFGASAYLVKANASEDLGPMLAKLLNMN